MKLSYKTFPGTTHPFSSASAKQQLCWVLIVAGGLLIAVRAGSFAASLFSSAPVPAAVATASAAGEHAATLDGGETPTPVPSSAVAAPSPAGAQEDVTAAPPVNDNSESNDDSQSAVAATAPHGGDDVVAVAQEVVSDESDVVPGTEQATELADTAAEPAVASTVESTDQQRAIVARVWAAFGARQADAGEALNAASDVATSDAEARDANSDLGHQSPDQFGTGDQTTGDAIVTADAPATDTGAALRSLFGAADRVAAEDVSSESPTASAMPPASPPHEQAEAVSESVLVVSEAAEISAGTNQPGNDAGSQPADESGADADQDAHAGSRDEATTINEQAAAARTQPDVAGAMPEVRPETPADEELVLVNPADSGGVIRYLVNGHSFEMAPGQTQRLPSGREWRVEFHRGGSFGDARQVLRSGRMEFRPTAEGWQLSSGK